ncbi:MAG: hypothetical protein QW095_00170 [Nitrososphaerota archaeon]
MACFIPPFIIAVITTAIWRTSKKIAEKLKLGILNSLLWGGVILLAIEHVWHGEVVPWPPFLTAMTSPSQIPVMLNEMIFTGGLMSIAVFTTWGLVITVPKILTRIHKQEEVELSKPFTVIEKA